MLYQRVEAEPVQAIATTKGQVVIPASLRKKYGIKKGTRIHIQDEDGRIMLRPVTAALVAKLRGKYRGMGMLRALMEERARDREREDAGSSTRV
jgi:AbrB family looped-hinge helix DNA binding protein